MTETTLLFQQKKPILRPSHIPFIRNFWQYQNNRLNFWLDTGRMNPITAIQFGPKELWVITDADYARDILQTKARNFPRSQRIVGSEDRIDNSHTVFNAPTWADWLWRRRLLQPAFHRGQLAGFAETMRQEAEAVAKKWKTETNINLKTEMKTLTMRIIGRTMFSAELDEIDTLHDCFEQLSKHSAYRTAALFPIPQWVPIPLYTKTRKAVDTRFRLVHGLVEQRVQSDQPKNDLLDMLIAANLEDGTTFTGEDIVHEMNSIIFAGHETTAATLTWLIYLVSQHPDIEKKLYQEIDEVLNGRPPTFADIKQMPYTEAVIKETLRLYPAVYLTLREPLEDDEIGDYPISAGTELVINIRGIQRDGRYWDDPDRFDPDRFSPDRDQSRHKNAFLPFISGPRKCIGDSFAMMEMQIVVPTLLQLCRFTAVGEKPQEKAGFIMEPHNEVEMSISPN